MNSEISDSYNFAKRMKGNHNPNMIMDREDWEIFRDDLRGKLGEIAVRNYIIDKAPDSVIETDIDFSVTGRGQWDIVDLVVNGIHLSVKSIRQQSKFLLVESKRYDDDGNYVYNNNDGQKVRIDYYVLVRVKIHPEVTKASFEQKYDDFLNKAWDGKSKREVKREFEAQVLGAISHDDFWSKKKYAPKGIKCSVKNLSALTESKSNTLNQWPDPLLETDSKNHILQQDNFVINGESQLALLENELLKAKLIIY